MALAPYHHTHTVLQIRKFSAFTYFNTRPHKTSPPPVFLRKIEGGVFFIISSPLGKNLTGPLQNFHEILLLYQIGCKK